MGADSAAAVQTALYSHLTGDSALMALLSGGVHDHVPAGTDFPYLVLGEMAVKTLAAPAGAGADITLALHVYSRAVGMTEVKAIVAALHDVLHAAALEVSGHDLVLCMHLDSRMALENDGITRHGIARYRIVTQPSGD